MITCVLWIGNMYLRSGLSHQLLMTGLSETDVRLDSYSRPSASDGIYACCTPNNSYNLFLGFDSYYKYNLYDTPFTLKTGQRKGLNGIYE